MQTKITLALVVLSMVLVFCGFTESRTVRITGADVTLLEIGAPAPDFTLFGTDYRYHCLDMYKDSKAVVLIFTCNHCPVSVAYEDDLVRIANEYQAENISFIAVNTNPADKVQSDGFEQMVERAAKKKFPFPYLYDETQKISAAYGARRTPHIFLLGELEDAGRRLLYTGSVDSRHSAPYYLKDALDAVLAGEEIKVAETEARGCTVKYRTREERAARFGYDVFR